MSKETPASNKKQHIDSALAAWAGPEAVAPISGSASSLAVAKGKGKASSRMFKSLVRHTSVRDNKETAGMVLSKDSVDLEALTLISLKEPILNFLCQFLISTYPREIVLSHFNQSNTGTWRSYYDGQKSPSPVVIELLSTLASQEDLSQAALESSLPPILNSASPADVCCSFWLYVTFTPESIIPPDLYNLFITPASLISHDVIVGILRSLFRKLSGAQASLFRTLSLFSHSLLLDSERSHRESLARVFSQAFSGRILMDPNPNRAAEDISCQWLFVDAPTIVDLERDPWTLKLYHSGSRILLPHTSSASSATLAPEILSPDQLTAPS